MQIIIIVIIIIIIIILQGKNKNNNLKKSTTRSPFLKKKKTTIIIIINSNKIIIMIIMNNYLSYNIHSMVDSFNLFFKNNSQIDQVDRFIRWNNDNYSCVILNVDGSCMGTSVRADFGGIIRNSAGYCLSGFSGCINVSSDILYAELYAINHGLIFAKSLNIIELVCYTDSLHCINLLKGPPMRYHVYAVLIQDVKDLIGQSNVIVCHTLGEGTHCADFFAKLGANSDTELLYHTSLLDDLLHLIRMDAVGTLYSRE